MSQSWAKPTKNTLLLLRASGEERGDESLRKTAPDRRPQRGPCLRRETAINSRSGSFRHATASLAGRRFTSLRSSSRSRHQACVSHPPYRGPHPCVRFTRMKYIFCGIRKNGRRHVFTCNCIHLGTSAQVTTWKRESSRCMRAE